MNGEKDKYEDMYDLPHHVSRTRPRMSVADRAAQFAPFAALTGYGAVIGEAARLTDTRPAQDEERLAELDGALRGYMADGAQVTVVYFEEDARKAGGAYKTCTGRIAKLDGVFKRIVMEDGTAIEAEEIVDISD